LNVYRDEYREDSQVAAFQRRYAIYLNLKDELDKLMKRRRAIGHWQVLFNKQLV